MCRPKRETIASLRQWLASELAVIDRKLEFIMTNQSTEQGDIDAAAAFDTQLDTDVKGLQTQVASGQQALDAAIAALKVASPSVDTSKLVAAQLVLAGDQPNLDAAVAALEKDPNITPTPAPAPAPAPTPPAGS